MPSAAGAPRSCLTHRRLRSRARPPVMPAVHLAEGCDAEAEAHNRFTLFIALRAAAVSH